MLIPQQRKHSDTVGTEIKGPQHKTRTRELRFRSLRGTVDGTALGVSQDLTWRFMGSYKWAYKSPNMGYQYSYSAYIPTYNYP